VSTKPHDIGYKGWIWSSRDRVCEPVTVVEPYDVRHDRYVVKFDKDATCPAGVVPTNRLFANRDEAFVDHVCRAKDNALNTLQTAVQQLAEYARILRECDELLLEYRAKAAEAGAPDPCAWFEGTIDGRPVTVERTEEAVTSYLRHFINDPGRRAVAAQSSDPGLIRKNVMEAIHVPGILEYMFDNLENAGIVDEDALGVVTLEARASLTALLEAWFVICTPNLSFGMVQTSPPKAV